MTFLCSVSSLMTTTEAVVSELPNDNKDTPAMAGGMGGMGYWPASIDLVALENKDWCWTLTAPPFLLNYLVCEGIFVTIVRDRDVGIWKCDCYNSNYKIFGTIFTS